ncbi:MAG: type II secretion system F family protein [Planctomycetaceae bacterium]
MRNIVLLTTLVLVAAASVAARRQMLRSRSRRRWESTLVSGPELSAGGDSGPGERSFLSRWLFLAGYRTGRPVLVFCTVTGAAASLGVAVALVFQTSGLQQLMIRSAAAIPGGVGETFLPVLQVAPWLLLVLLTSLPMVVVRRRRFERVALIEQDLPLALELLATLSEAGAGFDAAMARILSTRLAGRPLAAEFRQFQSELLAGISRAVCLRRLSSRIDIPAVSTFVSALVQAEQLGMGLSRVLRIQADDLRARRRERAIAFANSLATKRVIPLVICFLPGLFIWTLGPAFVEFFRIVETFIEIRGF